MNRLLALAVVLVGIAAVPAARAAEAGGTAPPAAPAEPVAAPATPAGLLAAADAAVRAGDLELARSLFERLANEHPGAPEANEARRALHIIAALVQAHGGARAPAGAAEEPAAAAGAAEKPAPAAPAGAAEEPAAPARAVEGPTAAAPAGEDGVIVRDEPYSLRTSERLRLTTWEKLDFGITAFLYGMSVGGSYSVSRNADDASEVLTPIALGALSYTLGSVAFLKLADPDRGDLPLALAITSYVPTTTLLVYTVSSDDPDGQGVGTATAAAGLLSIPLAVVAAQKLDLDPGDTQLVRDAGFWGLALATVGSLGFLGETQTYPWGDTDYRTPSGRKVAGAGLIGLYGGLGLGILAAHSSEVSLERVRVSTWGGYGGAVLGLLLGAAAGNGDERDFYRGTSIGALLGLIVTFATTAGLDGIPAEDVARRGWSRRLAPAMVRLADPDGRTHTGFGLAGTLF
jgi:hypothetical protein